jgi:hypothetical protein
MLSRDGKSCGGGVRGSEERPLQREEAPKVPGVISKRTQISRVKTDKGIKRSEGINCTFRTVLLS